MVLPSLFTKSSKKSKQVDAPNLSPSTAATTTAPSQGTPPPSPDKKSHSRVKDRERDRRSASYSSKRSAKLDRDSHPLNLPPDELHRLSSSAMSAMADQPTPQPMDIDRESTASPTPAPSSPAAASTPGSFSKTNGARSDESRPAPPPHRYTTSPPPSSATYATTPDAASPPPQAPTIDAEEYKVAGNKFFKIKDYPAAIKEYSKAIEADPNNATYYSNRAAALMSANRYLEALDDCKTADELEPGSQKIGLRLGRLYTSLGRPDEAIAAYNSIHATAKDMQPALQMQRHLKQAKDSLEGGGAGSMVVYALNEAERGLGVGVGRPRKWLLMKGEAQLRLGNVNAVAQAENIAMDLLRNNNQDPDALVLRGRALYAQGVNDKAIQHFRQALNCDPDFKDAVKYLRMVQKLDRTKEEGNKAFKAMRYTVAIETYTQALEIDPSNKGTNSKILQNRALCYSKQKNWEAAKADCDRALELDPDYTKAKKTRAKAIGELGDWEEATREYKAIQEQNPQEPGIAGDIRNAELELKKSKRKDYYKILGISKDANDNDIKKAYRKLAIVHHPDKNPDDDQAAERFKEIQEAHETLSDPQKRARYDSGEDLMEPEMGGFPGGGGGGMNIDPEILMQMFGGGMPGMGGGRGGGGGFSFSTGGGGSPFGGGMGGGMPGGGRQRGGQQFPGNFPF